MAEIVNLRTARKRAERGRAAERADRNRVAHGRTKADRAEARAERERSDRVIDGARLSKGDTSPSDR